MRLIFTRDQRTNIHICNLKKQIYLIMLKFITFIKASNIKEDVV